MDTRVREVDTDVLVIGGGSSGLWAAIRARDFCPGVTLVDKGIVASSGVSTFIHIVQSPLEEQEIPSAMRELVELSAYLADQKRLATLLREMGDRFREMESWGVPFERTGDGRLRIERRMGLKFNKAAFVNGRGMTRRMKEHALAKGVSLVERVMVTDLLTSDGRHPTSGRVTGAVGFGTVTGDLFIFRARAVIATTGLISAKRHLGYTNGLTGDGHAMAFRAGAELGNMELGQNHTFSIWDRRFCTGGQSEYMQAGARVINRRGEDIIEKYAPDKKTPHLSKSQICFAATKETLEGRGPIYMDMRYLTDSDVKLLWSILPSAMRAFDEAGIDIRRQPVEITPLVGNWGASSGGGLIIGLDGETTIPGLYAAGCASHNSANYFAGAGQGQAYNFASGYRAGEAAGKTALGKERTEVHQAQVASLRKQAFSPLHASTGPSPDDVFLAINRVTVPAEFSFFKHERRIRATLAEIQRVQGEELPRVRADDIHQLVKASEARNAALLVEVIYRCALERKESRFTHYREEFPYRDDIDWLKWIMIKRANDGMRIRFEPVPLEEYPVRPEKRSRIPAMIQFSWGSRQEN